MLYAYNFLQKIKQFEKKCYWYVDTHGQSVKSNTSCWFLIRSLFIFKPHQRMFDSHI